MLVAFTAGKYRSVEGPWGVSKNIDEARAVAHKLWKMGYAVICPHANTAHFDGPGYEDAGDWLEGTLELMRRCDVVVMLPGWKESRGAVAEHAEARRTRKVIYEWPDVPLAGFCGGGE